MDSFLIYGSYGYTGQLVVREAVSRGATPVVAGRNGAKVHRQADDLGLDGLTFDLSGDVATHLDPFDAVLNCAGPFTETADPIVEACLETETDYLDITGEFPIFERLRQRNPDAREAGITLLPGVGFEVVPSDCLAAFLSEHLSRADELTLGISGSLSISRGTARTLLELAEAGGVIRRNDRLVTVPPAFRSRTINFGDGPEHAVTAPWADVVTAGHSTGIDSIEVYVAVPALAAKVPLTGVLGRLISQGPIERLLRWGIDRTVDGPDEDALATDRAVVWGEVRDSETDRTVRGRVRTPNPYALTADAAVSAAERLLEGDVEAGFQTPATAFGSDFVLDLQETDRELLDTPTDATTDDRSAVEN